MAAMPESDNEAALARRLQRVVSRAIGPQARVCRFGTMEDGHAGLTFGFDVDGDRGPGGAASYVLKVAPAGVTRRGNTDVYRQAPLLHALAAQGLPVPAVPWASPDEDDLGVPYIVMEKLPGRVFVVWEPHASFLTQPERLPEIWLQAARLLARVHRIDWRTALADWEAPRPLAEEVGRWSHVLRHAQEPDWLAEGTALQGELLAAMPAGTPVGLIHGDFQPGNILYDDGRAGGLIDWELASIGAQGLDVGWLLMMSDRNAWHAGWQPVAPPPPREMVRAYTEAGGPATQDLAWYQALAQFRLGAIACLNVKLHRSGRRTDPLWERFAPSIAVLFARGRELVAAGAGSG